MFDIPYSDGILPSVITPGGGALPRSSVAPLPAATSGAAVNANGALVSFLPPVTDWFTPAAQNPTPATGQTQHPCQGGGECGCGGKCGGGNSAVPKASDLPLDINNELTVSPEAQARYMDYASLSKPGNSSIMTCITPSGEYLSAVAKVADDLTIALSVTELRSNVMRMHVAFTPKSDGTGWTARSNMVANSTVTIPSVSGLSLDSLSFACLSSSVVIGMMEAKIAGNSVSLNGNGSTQNGSAQDQPPCIGHDLVCTQFSGSAWPWTSDHRHLQWWAPCIGSFTTDIGDCCFKHDTALWCAHTCVSDPITGETHSIAAANEDAISCVMNAVLNNAWTLFKKLSTLEAIFCAPMFLAWVSVYGIPLGGLLELGWTIGLCSSLAADLKNYNHAHDKSCLCGGTEPTTQCSWANQYTGYTDCTDICQLAGDTANEECHKCGYYCTYDSTGKPTKHFDDGSDPTKNPNAWPCCPGTDQSCVGDGSSFTCPTCYDCYWICDPHYGWLPQTDPSGNHLPCCNATGMITTHGRAGGTHYDPLPPIPTTPCYRHGRIGGEHRAGG